MCVLHLLAPGSIGGAERVVEMLAAGQRAQGFDARVGAVIAGAAPPELERYLNALADAGVPVYRLRVGARRYGLERRRVGRLLAELRPQVVHTHGYRADVVDGVVAWRSGIAVVATAHGFTGGGWRNRCYEWIQRRTLRRLDAVVAVSHPMMRDLARAGLDGDRLHVVVNGWVPRHTPLPRSAARAALGLPGGALVVGWVGRISREKGLDVAIRALPALRDLPVVLAVVGGGPQARANRRLAGRLGVGAGVRWCGIVPEAGRLFGAFDVLLCSSRTEGTPIVLLEAMHAGVPIVATRVGGIPDLLTAQEASLVPAGRPDAIAAAVRDCVARREEAAARAAAARARLLRERDATRWVQEYSDVYHAAMRAARMRS